MKRWFSTIALLLIFVNNHGQDSLDKSWELKGYLKDLNIILFSNAFRNVSYTNLVHNRINFKWKPSEKITGAVEVRNRFYWGDQVQTIPHFGRQLRNDNEAMNLSGIWNISNNSVLQSNVERLWLEYRRTKWNVRAGRQRVNWGMANIWNPNDIFNTYNFLDFDYEERPGCDAVKIQYLVNALSNIEVTTALTNEKNKTISALKYSTNYKGYDLQFISGIFHRTFTAGIGWAGSIKNMGYKGEAQLFLNNKDSGNSVNLAMEVDYFFENGWYVNGAFLYNGNGLNAPVDDWSQVSFKISPTNLMPAKWNILLGYSKEFTPLFSGSLSAEYSPGLDMFIFYPSFKYNMATDFDIDFVWQSVFAQVENRFQDVTHAGFIRLKWSF
jgi:hypothetical protein